MRSNESGSAKACYIRVFGLLHGFLPIAVPTENRGKDRLDGMQCAAKIANLERYGVGSLATPRVHLDA